jgi:hypothetical protein
VAPSGDIDRAADVDLVFAVHDVPGGAVLAGIRDGFG